MVPPDNYASLTRKILEKQLHPELLNVHLWVNSSFVQKHMELAPTIKG